MDKKKKLFISIPIVVITLVVVAIILFRSMRPASIEISADRIAIRSLYSRTIEFRNIDEIRLSDDNLEFIRRINGSSHGRVRRGTFTIKGFEGNVFVSLENNTEKFIIIRSVEGAYYLFNARNISDTIAIYEEILQNL